MHGCFDSRAALSEAHLSEQHNRNDNIELNSFPYRAGLERERLDGDRQRRRRSEDVLLALQDYLHPACLLARLCLLEGFHSSRLTLIVSSQENAFAYARNTHERMYAMNSLSLVRQTLRAGKTSSFIVLVLAFYTHRNGISSVLAVFMCTNNIAKREESKLNYTGLCLVQNIHV